MTPDPDLSLFLSVPPEGPARQTWTALDAAIARLAARGIGLRHPAIRTRLAPVLDDPGTLMGHIMAWPWGHPGDFEIIDRLHRDHRSRRAPMWDAFIQEGAAGRAVRGRARFFVDQIAALVEDRGALSLLDLACGPCRDLAALHERLGPRAPATDAVDVEPAALAHAARLLGPRPGLRLIRGNAFRFRPDASYDAIWCAGLADYLPDRAVVALLGRMRRWLAPGGIVLLGNFTPGHGQCGQLDFCGWHLIHRSEAALAALARAALPGVPLRVLREETGVNAFCIIGPVPG